MKLENETQKLILLHKEYEVIFTKKLPVKILKQQEGTMCEEFGILNEDINVGHEVECYLKRENASRIIFPVNEYKVENLKEFLETPAARDVLQDTKIIKKVKKMPTFTETKRKLSIVEIAYLIKGELECILYSKIPTKITNITRSAENEQLHAGDSLESCELGVIVKEKFSPEYETQRYIIYIYNKANGYDTSSYKRVIHPINDYNLTNILKGLPEMCFLSIFAEIKHAL